jgi:hypothetical protein
VATFQGVVILAAGLVPFGDLFGALTGVARVG